jgi:hypothetical protein
MEVTGINAAARREGDRNLETGSRKQETEESAPEDHFYYGRIGVE